MTARRTGNGAPKEMAPKVMTIICCSKGVAVVALVAGLGLASLSPSLARDPSKGAAIQAKPTTKKYGKQRGKTAAQKSKSENPQNGKPAKDSKDDKTKAKTEAADADPQPLAEWSEEEIDKELALCRKILSKIDAVAIPMQSFRKDLCGAAAPIQLISVGRSPEVVFSPPARVTCKLAGALHKWITGDLQKLAKKHLEAEIIKVEVMSDYACRNAYGRKGGRLSEHALVNALDIRGFVASSGKIARLLAHWGPTRRDIAAELATAKKQAEARQAALDEDATRAGAAGEVAATGKGAGLKPQDLVKTPASKDAPGVAKLAMAKGQRSVSVSLPNAKKKPLPPSSRAKKPSLAKAGPTIAAPVPLNKRVGRSGWFLRQAHTSGCKIFGTILGPEANNAHRNHFHVDMAPRRRSNYCE